MPNVMRNGILYALCEKCGKSGCRPPHTRCSACRRQRLSKARGYERHGAPVREIVRERAPGWVEEQRELFEIEWKAAFHLRHRMGAIEHDTEPGSFISRCYACRGFLVGDPDEADRHGRPTPFYGRAYQTLCPGKPPPSPALRRSEMNVEAAWTSLGNEGSDRNPPSIDRWTWIDQERGPGFNLTMPKKGKKGRQGEAK